MVIASRQHNLALLKRRAFYFFALMILPSLWHKVTLANSADEYPNLFENRAASSNYEIVKLVDNSIAAVLYHEQSQQIVISTGNHLGKINKAGQLIDYFKTSRSSYSSGISFSQDDYNDWLFTGEKNNKPYDNNIDARGYSDEQLIELFNQAELVEFSTNNRYERKGYAHLYSNGLATLVDISDKADKIDLRCDNSDRRWEKFRWKDVCFEGYKQNKKLTFVEDISSWGRSSLIDNSDTQAPLSLMKFNREKYTLDEGISGAVLGLFLPVITGHSSEMPNAYWFGDAYFQLKHKDETLKFKLFADNEGEHINHRNFSIYQPESALFDDTKILVVNYRSAQHIEKNVALNKYYEQDVGLYVLRKKGLDSSSVIKPNITRWQPAFSGGASGKAITGTYSFPDRQLTMQYFVLTKAGKGKETLLRLPKTLSLDWYTKKKQERFTLKISNTKTAVYQHPTAQTQVSFAIRFDEEELRQSFTIITEELTKTLSDEVIKLEVQFNKLSTGLAQLKVGLASKSQFIELNDYSVHPIGNLKLAKNLKKGYEQALEDSAKLQQFFLQVKTLSNEPNYVDKHLAKVTYYFTKLILRYNTVSNYSASQKLTDFYAEFVFASLHLLENSKSTTTNHSIIISQAIAASIFLNDADMQGLIFDTLLGKSFDVSQSTSDILAFNLACFYALKNDKENMLIAVRRARQLGKPKSQFMRDNDFKAHRLDDDFLAVINRDY